MRWLNFYRFGFFILSIIVGRELGIRLGFHPLVSLFVSLGAALFLIVLEYYVSTRRAKDVVAFFIGIAIALVLANGVAYLICHLPILAKIRLWVYLASNLVAIYILGSFFYHKREELRFLNFFFTSRERQRKPPPKILDTSVIIDGRILGVAKSGFLEGELIVPRFILRELQRIADSKEHAKRTKGRKGLDVLRELQEIPWINVHISNEDFPRIKEVDHKLIELAKRKKGKLLTVDFNLKKLADLEGIPVLNINELTMELKPSLLPGDTIRVKVIKQGKEESQGVGYLPDGTMVVIEDGFKYLGNELICSVETVLQTEAGRMIFAKIKEIPQNTEGGHDEENSPLQDGTYTA